MPPRHRRGFTLPEALLAIVVLGLGLAGVMLAFSQTMRRGADPMLRLQMLAIAEGLMEEIQLKPFAAAANAAPAGCARDTFNDVADYNGYASTGICSVDGVAIPALANYRVSVSVQSATLAGLTGALRITVTTTQGGESLQLVGWRTNYAGP
jgi:MSHA pilin protein MshD